MRTRISKGERKPDSIDAMRLAWAILVVEYSRGQLTRRQDKLAAIFSVAVNIGKVISSSYFAGLWTDLLPEQLLWRVEASTEDLKARTTVYQAPAWPWAAANNPVGEFFTSGIFRSSFSFLISRVAVEAETYDMVIDQGQARLGLRGRLLNALLTIRDALHHSNEDLFHMEAPELDNADITVYPDHRLSAGHLVCVPVLASSHDPNYLIFIDSPLLERIHGKGTLSRIGTFRAEYNPRVSKSQFVKDVDDVIHRSRGKTLRDYLWYPDDIEIE